MGYGAKGLPQASMKFQPFALVTVFDALPPAARPLQTNLGIEIEDECQMRSSGADNLGFQRINESQVRASGVALVGTGRIHETVADDGGATCQRWPDERTQMGISCRVVEKRFRICTPLIGGAIDKQAAQGFALRRSARLTTGDQFEPMVANMLYQPRYLGGLAGALAALECNEKSLQRLSRPAPE